MSFVSARSLGNHGQERFLDIVREVGLEYKKNSHKKVKELAKWDISIGAITFEIKTDIRHKQTGNIAVEIYNPKTRKLSGVFTSEADYWVYVLEDIWTIKRPQLLELALFEQGRVIRAIGNGRGNASVKLFSKEVLHDHFSRLTPDSLRGIIKTKRASA